MGFNCGIVGLPNVGKSTLFNALTATMAAEAVNYPFCTIEPNIGVVNVPDERLDILGKIDNAAKIVPAQLEFVDIAGLVRGASKGEGLGNQFLGNIREVDAIIHVLRCFKDDNVTHVEGDVDPIRDAETVDTELMLADLESLEKRYSAIAKKASVGDKESKLIVSVMDPILDCLKMGRPARKAKPEESDIDRMKIYKSLFLLTAKPVLYVSNVDEASAKEGNAFSAAVAKKAAEEGNYNVITSAAIEAEVAQLTGAEQAEFLAALGLEETGLARVIRAGYDLLGLHTFFTSGPKESRAWTIKKGATAPEAAGAIHSDFEKGFIRAEIVAYNDYITLRGEARAREAGKLRSEGKNYVMKDGDVAHFLFNV